MSRSIIHPGPRSSSCFRSCRGFWFELFGPSSIEAHVDVLLLRDVIDYRVSTIDCFSG
jgi:hypothetical protein